MPLPPVIERALLRLADAAFQRRPNPVPDHGRLRACKIISHRGEHDNRGTMENTLAAFERAADAGVWGLEMDIRWTRDAQPVVFHDADLHRLHGCREPVAALSLDELKSRFPAIPSLGEVIARFGKKRHLMIEIKQQSRPDDHIQEQRLMAALRHLEPVRDFHLLALQPATLRHFSGVPSQARVAVCDGWPGGHSRWVRRHHWGGVCGHYLLMPGTVVQSHHLLDQRVGTGYVRSRNCLFRELNRGIDWIFSNHAVALQKILDNPKGP